MKNDPLIEILKNEFTRKKTRNGSYSLRSYSRDLDLDPSNLSKIMSYQKTIGPTLRSRIGLKLGFNEKEIKSWLKPATHEKTANQNYKNLNLDLFRVISEWQYYALLEYFKINNISSKPIDIANQLGLKVSVVNNSLKRLVELGLLKKNKESFFPADESSSSILNITTSSAHREQQRQILEGAIDALQNVPVEFRSQSSMTLAIDSTKINEARELIKNFRRDLGQFLSTSDQLDSVYQLSISLYPVTNQPKKGDLK
ncbi:MAG: DUF4423 domain-containing protein [Bacteriovorax sp.]|nr:DUF4423 domain-containing protein [Bacteriovorax sp.]